MQLRNRKYQSHSKQYTKHSVSELHKVPPKVNKKIVKINKDPKSKKSNPQSIIVPAHLAIYTVPQYKKYLTLFEIWQQKTNSELKNILHQNDYTMTGNKQQLVNKICDGILLGAIPRCPTCHKSRLRFDQSNGIYSCPGDSRDFEWCQEVLGFNDVRRYPWLG